MKRIIFAGIAMLFCQIQIFAQEKPIIFNAEPVNMGSNINSDVDDTDIRISPDGKTFYFIRWKSPENIGGATTDIYVSDLQADGTWSKARNMGTPINDEAMNILVGIRPDGNAIIVRGTKNVEKNTNLFISYRTGNTWGDLIPMEFEGTGLMDDYGCTVSPDFRTLISADKRDGRYDLFISFWKDNKWTNPQHMGTPVNTEDSEAWPVLASDGATLFYSSAGHTLYGSSDIVMTKRLDDTWLNWSQPVNLGEKINSSGYDADFIVDTKGDYAYFATNKSGTSFDIFRIELPKEAKPEPVVLVNGQVFNKKTNEPLEVEVVYYEMSTGKELGRAYSNASTGGYKILLPYGKKYSFKAEAPNYAAVSENIDLSASNTALSAEATYQELERNLYLVPIEAGSTVRINNLFFETGKAIINPDSYLELNQLAELMQKNPTLQIEIGGHTDNVGSTESNLALSQKRAKAVVDYLATKGVTSRITSKGYGEAKPVASNVDDAGKQQNRRVEFKIIKK